jgi:heptosyltransferase-3
VDLNNIHRILVIKLRHIGDVLLATPTLGALKRAMPHAIITAVVPAGTEDMLTLNPSVDYVLPHEKGRGALYEIGFIRMVRNGRFDLAINMTEGDRGAIMAFLSGARIRIGMDPVKKNGFIGKRHVFTHLVKPAYDGRHRAVMDMDVLAPLGIPAGEPIVELYTSAADDQYVERLLADNGIGPDTPVACVHPASRWRFKCWRNEAVAEVIDHLDGMGIKVALTSAPDRVEMQMTRDIIALARSHPVDLSGRLTLKGLAALLKRSCLFFGVDTAPMHMAAAVGTPVVALFGPSDWRIWGPLTDKAVVIKKDEEFRCAPCKRDGCEGSKRSRCLEVISVEEALAAIHESVPVGAAD